MENSQYQAIKDALQEKAEELVTQMEKTKEAIPDIDDVVSGTIVAVREIVSYILGDIDDLEALENSE